MKKYSHIRHEITTNGLLLDEEWIEILLSLKSKVAFSIDSVVKETYEYIRKGASFNRLIEKLELIKKLEQRYEKKLERSILVVVMKSNYRQLVDFVAFAVKYGFEAISFCPVMFTKGEENIFDNMNLDIQRYLSESMSHIRGLAAETGLMIFCMFREKIGCRENTDYKICASGDKKGLYCNLPWKTMWIDASKDGSILPDCTCCCPIGDINTDSLVEVWNNEAMQKYRKKLAGNDLGMCNTMCLSGMRAQEHRIL